MTPAALASFTAAVQGNCDVADARHAAELPLCTFLLQMREFYRWAERLPFEAVLARDAVGRWLAEREARWGELEGRAPAPLALEGRVFDPFDRDAINERLQPHGWIYGAGLAMGDRPVFFLAERLHEEALDDGLRVQHCGRETARTLMAPPAALQGGDTIVLRRESMARWLWERFETFSLRRADGPFGAVAEAFGLADGRAFADALPRLLQVAGELMLLHERGEHRAGRRLGPGWAELRRAAPDRRTALLLHAVRDLIADCTLTLPELLARRGDAGLHLWFAGFDGLREQLYPGLLDAYRAWSGGDGGAALQVACARGDGHFTQLMSDLLARPDPATVAARLADPAAVCR